MSDAGGAAGQEQRYMDAATTGAPRGAPHGGVLLRGRRPFGARRFTAKPEIGRSDSSARVHDARSVACESAMPVHAAMAGEGIGYYSRRDRKGMSGGRFPAGRSRTPAAQQDAAKSGAAVRLPPSPRRGYGGRGSRTLRTIRTKRGPPKGGPHSLEDKRPPKVAPQ